MLPDGTRRQRSAVPWLITQSPKLPMPYTRSYQSPARYAADSPFLGALPLGTTFAHALGTNVLARAMAQLADR